MTSVHRQSVGWIRAVVCVSALLATPFCDGLRAQDISRRALEHKDYDVWSTMTRSMISKDGEWVAYTVQSGAIDGEATLHVHHAETGREYVIDRGSSARFSADGSHLVYRVTPDKKLVKRLRKEKEQADDLPKAKLQILELESGDIVTVERVRSFQLPEDKGPWVACLLEPPLSSDELKDEKPPAREIYEVSPEGLRRPAKEWKLKSREQLARERGEVESEPTRPKSEPKREVQKPTEEETESSKKRSPGTPLTLINLETGVQRTYPFVAEVEFSKNGEALAFSTSVEPDGGDDKDDKRTNGVKDEAGEGEKNAPTSGNDVDTSSVDGVHVINLKSRKRTTIAHGPGEYKNLTFSESGSRLAFISNQGDEKAESPSWAVYLWASNAKEAKKVAAENDRGMLARWWVSPRSSQRFSEDGQRLYFDTAPIPSDVVKERKAKAEGREIDDEESDDKAKLDIWHWQDPQLQPQQVLQAESERDRDYPAAYILKAKRIVQLATRHVPEFRADLRSTSSIALARTNIPYRKMLSWDVPGFQDIYRVNLNSGKRELMLEKVRWNVSLSPDGNFVVWFDSEQKSWFAKSARKAESDPIEISKGVKHPLQDELHDEPTLPQAYGLAGWLTNDRALLVYDRYDIWQLDPTGESKPVCVTGGFGRANDIRFRYRKLDPEERGISPSAPMILEAFNRKTKASGFYELRRGPAGAKGGHGGEHDLHQLIMLDEDLGRLQKAKESDRVVFTRSSFRTCPDLWLSTTSFKKISRVSDMNPQQEAYTWGTAELTRWKSADGQELDGILMKPDGFDPSKRYPMMVYFYERMSDSLHDYYAPAAGRSIICHSFYVSRGYLVFIPDIPYETGEPGQSAANSVIPGVEHLIDQGFVDKERIGMQGHSWGGYQTAYLATQTDLFACAESGAPVSNMTSAYGGIRWGTGRSRMFQYERTQSRIGEDLWSGREKFIANSPLFLADKIDTPLLILHNDEDGAVPWYQGIELFVALRRLEKPAWMLNYNGEPHWVMREPNRRDFAIRLQQFFDHYLKDAPEPEWMAVGVPAVEKGKRFGLELLEPESQDREDGPAKDGKD